MTKSLMIILLVMLTGNVISQEVANTARELYTQTRNICDDDPNISQCNSAVTQIFSLCGNRTRTSEIQGCSKGLNIALQNLNCFDQRADRNTYIEQLRQGCNIDTIDQPTCRSAVRTAYLHYCERI